MPTDSFKKNLRIEQKDAKRFLHIMSKSKNKLVKNVENHQDVKGKDVKELLKKNIEKL